MDEHFEYRNLLYDKKGRVLTLTFNRPEQLNTFEFPGAYEGLSNDMIQAIYKATNDDEIKVAILKGAGQCFTAGHDLTDAARGMEAKPGQPPPPIPPQRFRLRLRQNMEEWWHRHLLYFPKQVISQIHGFCAGEGVVITCLSDYAIAAEDAIFRHAEQRYVGGGMIDDFPLLVLHMGLKRATEFLVMSRTISGKEAAALGLVNRAVPAAKLEEEVQKWVDVLLLTPADGIAIGKRWRAGVLSSMGFDAGLQGHAFAHTVQANFKPDDDELNLLKLQRDKGLSGAIKEFNAVWEKRHKALGPMNIPRTTEQP